VGCRHSRWVRHFAQSLSQPRLPRLSLSLSHTHNPCSYTASSRVSCGLRSSLQRESSRMSSTLHSLALREGPIYQQVCAANSCSATCQALIFSCCMTALCQESPGDHSQVTRAELSHYEQTYAGKPVDITIVKKYGAASGAQDKEVRIEETLALCKRAGVLAILRAKNPDVGESCAWCLSVCARDQVLELIFPHSPYQPSSEGLSCARADAVLSR
jgi:hypothetical protein